MSLTEPPNFTGVPLSGGGILLRGTPLHPLIYMITKKSRKVKELQLSSDVF